MFMEHCYSVVGVTTIYIWIFGRLQFLFWAKVLAILVKFHMVLLTPTRTIWRWYFKICPF